MLREEGYNLGMKPKRIVLIRHGESEANADEAVRATTPDHQLNLTPRGVRQAEAAGTKLLELFGEESIAVYRSPYRRTRQTYEHLLKGAQGRLRVLKEYEDARLREQDFGHLRPPDAYEKIEAERKHFGTFFFRIPDGESGADVEDRISIFLDTLWRDFEKADFPRNVLVVSHGLTIRLFCKRWFHWTVEEFERLKNPRNCEHFVMELGESGKYKLKTHFRLHSEEETRAWKKGE